MRSILYPVLFLLDVLRASSFPLFLVYICLSFLRPIDIFVPEWLDHRPMLWLFLVAFVGGVLDAAHRRRFGMNWLHIALLLAFVAAIVLSQMQFGQTGGAVTAALDFSASAFIFVLAALNLVSIQRIRIAGAAWLITMLIATVLSLYAYYTGFHWQALVLQQAASDASGMPNPDDIDAVIPAEDMSGRWLWRIRGIAILSDPNDFAQVLVAVFPFIWTFAGQRPWAGRGTALHAIGNVVQAAMNKFKGSRFLVFAMPAAAILLFGIYMTHSRGAVLGLASLTFFIFLKRLGATRTAMLLALGAVAAVAINVGGGREMSMNESSAEDRISAWRLALDLLKMRPILGVGYANFLEHNELTAHNSFVLCFAELGLFGYFFWLALLVLAYMSLKRVLDRFGDDTEAHHMAVLLRSSMLGYLTCAWFLSRSYSAGLFLLLGMCISVLYAARYDLLAAREKAERHELAVARQRKLSQGTGRPPSRPAGVDPEMALALADARAGAAAPLRSRDAQQRTLATSAGSRRASARVATRSGSADSGHGQGSDRGEPNAQDRARRRRAAATGRAAEPTTDTVVDDTREAELTASDRRRGRGGSAAAQRARGRSKGLDQLLEPRFQWVITTLISMVVTIVAVQAIVTFAGLNR